jgi:hypothetical protein
MSSPHREQYDYQDYQGNGIEKNELALALLEVIGALSFALLRAKTFLPDEGLAALGTMAMLGDLFRHNRPMVRGY